MFIVSLEKIGIYLHDSLYRSYPDVMNPKRIKHIERNESD